MLGPVRYIEADLVHGKVLKDPLAVRKLLCHKTSSGKHGKSNHRLKRKVFGFHVGNFAHTVRIKVTSTGNLSKEVGSDGNIPIY